MKLHPRLSAEGVVLARRGERLRREAERDATGWVIGYGHRAGAREGARVDEDDARVLLVYDLSRTADGLTPLLARDPPQPLFDAFNAYAWRVGPEALADSDLLRRWNAGEAVTATEVMDANERAAGEGPPSAVLAAAAAVRDRVSRVLDAPPAPPPARGPREPWPEPAAAPASEVAAPDAGAASTGGHPDRAEAVAPAPADDAPGPSPAEPADGPGPPPLHDVPPEDAGACATEEPPPPPLLATLGPPLRGEAPPHEAPPAWETDAGSDGSPLDALPLPPPPAPLPAPVVSFERGGRARAWDRVRADPRLYIAVGACGLLLFLCALAGAVVARPTALGVAMGLTGVLCLAPALAFFLHRRA